MFSYRYYSTSNSESELCDLPSPILTINLENKVNIKSYPLRGYPLGYL